MAEEPSGGRRARDRGMMRHHRAWLAGVLLVALALHAAPKQASGQTAGNTAESGASPDASPTAALNRALEDGGVEAALEMARLAIRAGRYEQAAGILTGLQARDPNNPLIKLLLGDLYTRLGSRKQAQVYLRQALESEQLAREQRRTAEALLAFAQGASRRGDQGWRFSGTLRAGLRYSSNANAGTDANTILIGDVVRPATDRVSEEADVSSFLYGYGQATKPVAQRFSLDARGFVYGRKQFDLEDQDLAAVRAQPGLIWDAVKTRDYGLRLRPYAILAATGVGREHALTQLGGGLRAVQRIDRDWFFDQTLELSRANYRNTDERPPLNQLDGDDRRLSLGITHRITEAVTARVTYRLSQRDTRQAFLDRTRHRIRVAASADLPWFWTGMDDAPTVRGGVSYLDASYDGPDPSVSATTTREDTEWRFDTHLTLPVRDGLAVELGADYSRTDSNLPNYERDEFGATAGIRFDF